MPYFVAVEIVFSLDTVGFKFDIFPSPKIMADTLAGHSWFMEFYNNSKNSLGLWFNKPKID